MAADLHALSETFAKLADHGKPLPRIADEEDRTTLAEIFAIESAALKKSARTNLKAGRPLRSFTDLAILAAVKYFHRQYQKNPFMICRDSKGHIELETL